MKKQDNHHYLEKMKDLDVQEAFEILKEGDIHANINWEYAAYLNWSFEQWNQSNEGVRSAHLMTLAESYFDTSLLIGNYCLERISVGDKISDIMIFPLIFNSNHAIELTLKSIILDLRFIEHLNKGCQFDADVKGHQIFKLLGSAKELAKKFDEDDEFKIYRIEEQLSYIEVYLNQYSEYTHDFTEFRYPYDQKGNSYFYNNQGQDNIMINVSVCLNKVRSCFIVASNISSALSSLIDQTEDVKYYEI